MCVQSPYTKVSNSVPLGNQMEEDKQEGEEERHEGEEAIKADDTQDGGPRSSQPGSQPSSQPSSSATVILTRLIALAGQVAFRQMVHLDTYVFGELKRRRAIQEQKKDMKTPRADKRGSKVVRWMCQTLLILN